jgi:hypothetical protein
VGTKLRLRIYLVAVYVTRADMNIYHHHLIMDAIGISVEKGLSEEIIIDSLNISIISRAFRNKNITNHC